MTNKTKSSISEEIRVALSHGEALTSVDLLALCPSAETTTDVSRAIYDLRQVNLLADAGMRPNAHPGRGSTVLKAWRWAGPLDAPLPSVRQMRKGATAKPQETSEDGATATPEPFTLTTPMEEVAEIMAIAADRTDAIELALSDLVDQADEALLALADSLLADNALWGRLRALANDAFNARCDYRLMRTLEAQ